MGAKELLKLKEQEVLDLQEQVRTLTNKAAEYEQLYKEELNKNSCYEAEEECKYESFLKLNDKYLKRYIADNSDLLKEKVKEVIKEVSVGVKHEYEPYDSAGYLSVSLWMDNEKFNEDCCTI